MLCFVLVRCARLYVPLFFYVRASLIQQRQKDFNEQAASNSRKICLRFRGFAVFYNSFVTLSGGGQTINKLQSWAGGNTAVGNITNIGNIQITERSYDANKVAIINQPANARNMDITTKRNRKGRFTTI